MCISALGSMHCQCKYILFSELEDEDEKPSRTKRRVQSARGPGSLERQRTAWATSVGHKRVTRAEVQQR